MRVRRSISQPAQYLAVLCVVLIPSLGACNKTAMICGVRVRQQLISSRQCKRTAPCRSRISISTSVPPLAPASSSWSSSSNSSTVAAEPVADKGADKVTAPTEGAGLSAAGRAATPRRWEWRPSEAHKASATSVARKQVHCVRSHPISVFVAVVVRSASSVVLLFLAKGEDGKGGFLCDRRSMTAKYARG